MFKKTKIAAVTAAVLGLSSMALVPNAQAVSVNESGATGQVLIFPYYNVNNGFTTSFNITNTTNKYKAVKMRFRESKTSNDVLDFNVYMSPEDVFTVFLTQGSDGGVLLSTNDKTCTHPKFPGAPVAFRDVYDSVENADMREGYLEVIEMGEVNEAAVVDTNGSDANGDVKIASEGLLHDSTGTPKNCDVVELAWQQGVFVQGGATSNAGAINIVNPNVPGYPDSAAMGGATTSAANFYGLAPATAKLFADGSATVTDLAGSAATSVGAIDAPTGGLAGSSVLIDLNNVAGFVAEPVSVVNYSTRAQHYLSSDQNFYLLPSLASGNVLTTDTVADAAGARTATQTTWGIVARDFGLDDTNVLPRTQVPSGVNPMPMAHALAVTSLANQYFVEGDTSTDWVISAPMRKHGILNGYEYHANDATTGNTTVANDLTDGSIAIDAASDASDAAKLSAAQANGYWTLNSGYDLKSEFNYYDREEQFDSPSVSAGDFSPPIATPTTDANIPFNNEVNILALSASGSDNASVLGSANKQGVSLATGFTNGWGTFGFSYDLNALYDTNTSWASAGGAATGAPLSGFMAAKGSLGGQNVGEVFPHIMKR